MFCSKCGKEMEDGAEYCPYCGEKIEGISQNEGSSKKSSVKNKSSQPVMFAVIAAVFVALVIIFAVISMTGKHSSSGKKDVLYLRTYYDNGWCYLFQNSKGETKDIDDISGYSVYFTGDQTLAAYITSPDNTLYYIDKDLTPVKIADDILICKVSMSGDYITYGTGDGISSCDLYLYDVKKKESTKISSDVHFGFTCLSPNGGTVVYVKKYEDMTSNDMYLGGSGKESVRIGKDGCFPIAVSDNGKNLFYVRLQNGSGNYSYDYDLLYYDGKESDKLAANVSLNHIMYTNSSVTELLYVKESRTYYFSTKQGEAQKVNSNVLSYLNRNVAYVYNPLPLYAQLSVLYDIDSLTNSFYCTSDDSLVWLSKDGQETSKVTSKWDSYKVSESGNAMLYVYRGDLYKAENFSPDAEAKLLYDDLDITGFVTSKDLSRIYLITEDDELYYYRDSEHVVRLSNDLQSSEDAVYCETDKKIYFIENDSLYRAGTAANSKERLVQDICELSISADGTSIIYAVEEADDEFVWYLYTENGPVELYTEYTLQSEFNGLDW